LTGDSRNTVAAFVKKFSIPWPSGYETTWPSGGETNRNGLVKFGPIPGGSRFAVPPPTLYLIDSEGTILWNDGRSRLRHRDPKDLRRELEREIEKVLRASSL